MEEEMTAITPEENEAEKAGDGLTETDREALKDLIDLAADDEEPTLEQVAGIPFTPIPKGWINEFNDNELTGLLVVADVADTVVLTQEELVAVTKRWQHSHMKHARHDILRLVATIAAGGVRTPEPVVLGDVLTKEA